MQGLDDDSICGDLAVTGIEGMDGGMVADYNSSVIVLTRQTGATTIDGSTVAFNVSGITFPREHGEKAAFSINTTLGNDVAIDVLNGVAGPYIFGTGGSIRNVSVTLENPLSGRPTTVMFNFTVDTDLDSSVLSTMIRISFPTGYDIELSG